MGRFSVKKIRNLLFIKFNNKLALTALHSAAWNHYWQGRCINRKWLSWDRKNYIFQKVTKMGSIIGQKIDKNGVGALRGQRHIPSKHLPKYPPPPPLNPRTRASAPLPWLNSDSFLPRPVIMIMSGIINTKFDRRLQPLTVDLSIITFCVQEPIALVRVRSRTRASISLFGDIFLVFWPS